jgi:hypothetical protein
VSALFGMRVVQSSLLGDSDMIMVRDGETMQRFIWTANALADQEREIERLRAEVERLKRAASSTCPHGCPGWCALCAGAPPREGEG